MVKKEDITTRSSCKDLDSEGQLSRLFIANPTSIQMIRSWPHLGLINTTYKMNKQKWPLCEIIGMTLTNHNFLVAFCLMRDEAYVSYSWGVGEVERYLWQSPDARRNHNGSR